MRIRTTRILTTTLGIALAFSVSLGLTSIPGSAYAQSPSLVYPASIVTERAKSGSADITGVIFGDGRNVNGTCSPGGTLNLNFEWRYAQVKSYLQQISVGFVGGDTRCVASGVTGGSGSSALALTCPKAQGYYQLGMLRTECYGCPPDCGQGGSHRPPGNDTPGYGVSASGASFVGAVRVYE